MDSLSSFSFGNIIKTAMPGFIAIAALWLWLELAYHLLLDVPLHAGRPLALVFWSESLAATTMKHGSAATVLGLMVVPASLLLGFVLNTIVWLLVNPWLRRMVRLGASEKAALGKLEELGAGIAVHFDLPANKGAWEPHLPSLLLPSLDMQKVAHVYQSYFSWYEFQVNSALASVLVMVSYWGVAKVLSAHWKLDLSDALRFAGADASVIFISLGALAVLMIYAGFKNLQCHEERVIWLMLGSLYATREQQRGAAAAGARPADAAA